VKRANLSNALSYAVELEFLANNPVRAIKWTAPRSVQTVDRRSVANPSQARALIGSKGDRLYAWAWLATAGPRHYLLVRRNLTDPTDQAYFYCYVPESRPATLGALVTVAGMRWPVEDC
jgi:hypothetical protein